VSVEELSVSAAAVGVRLLQQCPLHVSLCCYSVFTGWLPWWLQCLHDCIEDSYVCLLMYVFAGSTGQ
jgi:hypothetical protein